MSWLSAYRNNRQIFWVFVLMTVLTIMFIARDIPIIRSMAERRVVDVIENVSYVDASRNPDQRLDLYLPKGRKDFPVVIFVHGGFWTSGRLEPVEPFRIANQVRREAMNQRSDGHENVTQMGAGGGNGFQDIRDGCPDLKGLIAVEQPDSEIKFQVARQDSEDVPKWSERVPGASLRITLSTRHEQLGMSFVCPPCELLH